MQPSGSQSIRTMPRAQCGSEISFMGNEREQKTEGESNAKPCGTGGAPSHSRLLQWERSRLIQSAVCGASRQPPQRRTVHPASIGALWDMRCRFKWSSRSWESAKKRLDRCLAADLPMACLLGYQPLYLCFAVRRLIAGCGNERYAVHSHLMFLHIEESRA